MLELMIIPRRTANTSHHVTNQPQLSDESSPSEHVAREHSSNVA